ncbi:MAG: Ppx/GppA phosphatase family protein [Actinomycetota bacterium]|nr:Ppx/GppA phosphatase family protein [Actinomycetota bacterium]
MEIDYLKDSELANMAPKGVTVAALDMGSNSFHLVVARGHGRNNFEVILKEKEMMRLGDEVAATKRFSDETRLRIAEVVARMTTLSKAVGATTMKAVATAAFRDARNAGVVVDELEESLGIKVSVIAGRTEAELIWTALSQGVDFGGDTVVGADLGGGSLEIMVGEQSQLIHCASYPLGVGKLTSRYRAPGTVPGIDKEEVARAIRQNLDEEMIDTISQSKPSTLILSSGSLLNIARMTLLRIDEKRWNDLSINQSEIPIDELRTTCKMIISSDFKGRSKLLGVDDKRVDLLPSAAIVLTELLAIVNPKRVLASEWALREGIILKELSLVSESEFEGDNPSLKVESITAIAERYKWNERHSRKVAELAVSIFDQTKKLHGLSEKEREILYLAGLSHDIGEFISVEGHDRHSAYLLENSRLPGFDINERNCLLSVVRFHRKGTPKNDYPPFAELNKAQASSVLKLTALLRLADALDRSHRTIVESVKVVIEREQLLLFVDSSSAVELEEYGLRRKRQLFEDVFKLDVHLITN